MDGSIFSSLEITALVLEKEEWIQIDVGIDLSLDNHNLLFRSSNRCLEEAFLDCRWTRNNWFSTELVMRVFCFFVCI